MELLSPGLVLSIIISTACGAAFHALRGEGYGKLLWYLLAAWVGFALGQGVAWLANWQFAMMGQVHLVEGVLGSLVLMILVSWTKLK